MAQKPAIIKAVATQEPMPDIDHKDMSASAKRPPLRFRKRAFMIGIVLIWLPVILYLIYIPKIYVSSASLIVPSSGISTLVNLNDIGQTSTNTSSAFASSSVSPTETYKRLLSAPRIRGLVADNLQIRYRDISPPQIELVDQTGLILIKMKASDGHMAQQQMQALIDEFQAELNRLRRDEVLSRQTGGEGAFEEYQRSVQKTRAAMTALQEETGLHSVGQYRDRVNEADQLEARLETVITEVQQMTEQVNRLQTQLGLAPEAAASILRLYADGEYLSLIEQMGTAATELTEARSQFGKAHPKVITAKNAYDAMLRDALTRAAMITGLEREVLSGLDMTPTDVRADLLSELVRQESERAGLYAQQEKMKEQLRNTRTELALMAPAAARLEDMQRDFDVAKTVFASATARSETSKTDIYASYPLVQVIEDPSLPEQPSTPMTKLVVAAGVLATLALLIGLLMIRFRHVLLDPQRAGEWR